MHRLGRAVGAWGSVHLGRGGCVFFNEGEDGGVAPFGISMVDQISTDATTDQIITSEHASNDQALTSGLAFNDHIMKSGIASNDQILNIELSRHESDVNIIQTDNPINSGHASDGCRFLI